MNLTLQLKTQWFEMTKSGDKLEDYREITVYWIKRLLLYEGEKINASNGWRDNQIEDIANDLIQTKGCLIDVDYQLDLWYLSFKPFTTNTMTKGYPKSTDTDKIDVHQHAGIEIRTGRPEWGAEEGKLYFVIKHGKQLTAER